MKYAITILILLKVVTSAGQYSIDRIFVDESVSDTTYVKEETDSIFRLVGGVYVFSHLIGHKYHLPWGSVQGKPSSFAPSTHSHPISEVTNLQSTLDGKLATNGNGGSLTGLTKSQVGLANADNTSDASKPVSTATQTALNNKSTIHFGLDAGGNDSYVITASPAPASYTQGMVVIFRANTQNTTGCSINVNGLGVVNIVKRVSTTLATGDILSQMFCMLVYNGTAFVILNPVVN